MTPTKITFDLGRDQYGRAVHLVREVESNGQVYWTLTRYASDQRDETRTIERLPGLVMRRLVNSAALPKIDL